MRYVRYDIFSSTNEKVKPYDTGIKIVFYIAARRLESTKDTTMASGHCALFIEPRPGAFFLYLLDRGFAGR
jgi:hypothetical protein